MSELTKSPLGSEWLRFSVLIESQDKSVTVIHKDHGSYDVNGALLFGEDISVALEYHSPTVAWWASMVAEERDRLRRFQEGPYVQAMAHFRYYAKLALKGMGDKETLESVRDCVVLLFSKSRQRLSDTMMKAAWYGNLLTEHSTATGVKKYLDSAKKEDIEVAKEKFNQDAYYWETVQGVSYDDVLLLDSEIQKNVEILGSVLKVFEQRGILLSSLAADKRAETRGMATSSLNKLVEETVERIVAGRA
jgi:hypothetical protein